MDISTPREGIISGPASYTKSGILLIPTMLDKTSVESEGIPFFFQPPFYSRNTAEMYDNILNKPLQLKPNITNSARHLLEGLLQKDRTKRLGAKEDFVSIAVLLSWDRGEGHSLTSCPLLSPAI